MTFEERKARRARTYLTGQAPKVGDVVDSDGSLLLVLAVEPIPAGEFAHAPAEAGDQRPCFGLQLDTAESIWLRGVSPEMQPPYGSGEGWMRDTGPDHRNAWLPWRCMLVRRDALGEIKP